MNVKPGDFARLIADPSFPENVGAQMVVVKAATLPLGYYYVDAEGNPIVGDRWECRVLQAVRAFFYPTGKPGLVSPGGGFVTMDAYLRRIDPPEGTEELYRDVPTEEEKDLGLIVLSERLP
jgi:hypothetical protein